jgi:mevalonate kinase
VQSVGSSKFTAFATSAPGKIILSGEHAVVHGARAVATTVEKRTFAFFEPLPAGTTTAIDAARLHRQRNTHLTVVVWCGDDGCI